MKSDVAGDGELRKECERLRAENARLMTLLEKHGISWEPAHSLTIFRKTPARYPCEKQRRHMEPAEKVALFRRLFRGRTDVYPLRWESAKGRSGYSPACGNEWRPGICRKPKVKCGDCDQRLLLPVTDQVIYDHLAGKHTVGVYPLLSDDTCFFLAADFDEDDWREDARSFMDSCRELSIPAAMEISRSGKGAHQGVFVLSYLSNNTACLKKVLDKRLRIRYMSNHVTLNPGGNCVEAVRSPCQAHPSV